MFSAHATNIITYGSWPNIAAWKNNFNKAMCAFIIMAKKNKFTLRISLFYYGECT
jgi:hypothetical protein